VLALSLIVEKNIFPSSTNWTTIMVNAFDPILGGTTVSGSIDIKPLTSQIEIQEVEEIQKQVWGFPDLEITPASVIFEAQQHGAMILGAFDGKDQSMVGFLYGFVGLENGIPYHASSLMGVLSAYQSRNICYRLKLHQRQFILSQGLKLAKWTFDPLESANAHLNIRKLGGIAKANKRNLYGSDYGDLNTGLPTDRLVIEWHVDHPDVARRLEGGETPQESHQNVGCINQRDIQQGIKDDYDLQLDNPTLMLEIPSDFQRIKQKDMDAAMEWRMATREIFNHYFSRHYVVSDFQSVVREDSGSRRCFYVFKRVDT